MNENVLLLATVEPTRPQRRFAFALAVCLIVVFAGAASFAAMPLWQVYPVVPALLAICFLSDVITATLLFSQYSITQSRALLALASGYLFAALIVIPIALTYPGLFTPTGLLGAGLQTASWLYISWHFGFPAAVLAYALLKDGSSTVADVPVKSAIWWSIAVVAVSVGALTWLFTSGNDLVPRLALNETALSPLSFYLGSALVLFTAVTFGLLWMRQRSVLDQWLLIATLAFLLETVMSAVLVSARFTVGFYVGVVLLLFNATIVMVVLLTETTRLYARIIRSHKALQETQASLIESEKLAALGRLVTGVAHEINSPVGISLTVASTLKEKGAGFAAEVARGNLRRSKLNDFLEMVEEASAQLVANLNRSAELIQSFKQVGVDRNHLDQRTFDAGELTEQILMSLRPGLRKNNLALDVDCQPGLVMNSYPGPFGQVLTNLLLNSITHAFQDGKGGEIAIRLRASGNADVEVLVSDSGCGMSLDVRRQAFNPFFTTRRNHGSTGLGLHIVHNIVTNRLGGKLDLDSEPGAGTRIRIVLPRVAPAQLFVKEGG